MDNIDQLFRCAKGQIEIIYLSGLQNSKRQRALPATHDNQQLKVLAGGQVQRSAVKQVVISFSQLSEWKNPAGSYYPNPGRLAAVGARWLGMNPLQGAAVGSGVTAIPSLTEDTL